MVVVVAEKGAKAYVALTSLVGAVVLAAGFLIASLLDGYFLEGTYGGLVVPLLVLSPFALKEIRTLARHIYAPTPLIFLEGGRFSYVAPGHASVPMADVAGYKIRGGIFPRLYFYDGRRIELGHYPLFLSSSSRAEVNERLSTLSLRACVDRPATQS